MQLELFKSECKIKKQIYNISAKIKQMPNKTLRQKNKRQKLQIDLLELLNKINWKL
jgi:hypothetical protein